MDSETERKFLKTDSNATLAGPNSDLDDDDLHFVNSSSEFLADEPGLDFSSKVNLIKAVNAFGASKKIVNKAGLWQGQGQAGRKGSVTIPSTDLKANPSANENKFKGAATAVMAMNALSPEEHASSGVTPAQAMASFNSIFWIYLIFFVEQTRLTGTIFDDDHQIPAYLSRPSVFIVSTADSVREKIEKLKPALEQLIFFETLTSTLYITFGLFTAFWLGYFGFSSLWLYCLMLCVVNAFKRDFKKAKRKIVVDADRKAGLRKVTISCKPIFKILNFFQYISLIVNLNL
jgi:hypothetical protein